MPTSPMGANKPSKTANPAGFRRGCWRNVPSNCELTGAVGSGLSLSSTPRIQSRIVLEIRLGPLLIPGPQSAGQPLHASRSPHRDLRRAAGRPAPGLSAGDFEAEPDLPFASARLSSRNLRGKCSVRSISCPLTNPSECGTFGRELRRLHAAGSRGIRAMMGSTEKPIGGGLQWGMARERQAILTPWASSLDVINIKRDFDLECPLYFSGEAT